jgi:glycerol uptake facilitator-like aquaporin
VVGTISLITILIVFKMTENYHIHSYMKGYHYIFSFMVTLAVLLMVLYFGWCTGYSLNPAGDIGSRLFFYSVYRDPRAFNIYSNVFTGILLSMSFTVAMFANVIECPPELEQKRNSIPLERRT